VLTCRQETFVSRVAASILYAVGLPELVCDSLVDYEARALHLATHPHELRALRERLEQNRMTAPLFDTPRYTRDFERALLKMAALRDDGRPPEAFTID
jgi:predicted O-linked N-acetylglucosamine transferase (SPINDLY family)